MLYKYNTIIHIAHTVVSFVTSCTEKDNKYSVADKREDLGVGPIQKINVSRLYWPFRRGSDTICLYIAILTASLLCPTYICFG